MPGAKRVARPAAPASVELSSGRHGLERAQVIEIQRARILAAMFDIALEQGAGKVSVAHVVERSGVSRRTFYEIFADREECFLAAFEDAIERIAAVVVPAYESERRWHERIRAALVELLGLFDEQPGLGRLLIVESLGAGPRVLERRGQVLDQLTAAVDQGRAEAGASFEPPLLIAEGVVGAVCSILYSRLLDFPPPGEVPARGHGEKRESLLGLSGSLMSMIVLPYLGKAAARRELERPAPAPRTLAPREDGGYQLRDLGMRLTYRTLRVLEAVARNHEASNRLLGDEAGISDQGQISKLLWRLQHLGLVENVAHATGKGTPNAWRLTDKGRTMHKATEAPRGRTGL